MSPSLASFEAATARQGNVSWIFETPHMTSVTNAPKGKEHFQGDSVDVVVRALVREALQNARDAHDTEVPGPVEVRFSRRAMPFATFERNFMDGLRRHIEGAREAARAMAGHELFANLSFDDDVEMLVIEDYNTTGLRGGIDDDYYKHEFQNFVSFWLRQGVSSKKGDAGGRHGVGKNALSEASALRTIFGVTHRVDAPRLVGYGQASFYPHHIDRKLHSAYGMFGKVRSGHAYPITGADAVTLSRNAGFDREKRNGFSVMIPFVKAEITDEAIIREVISQTYCQICLDLLVVVVGDVRIDRDTILDLALEREETAALAPAIKVAAAASSSDTGHPVFRIRVPEGVKTVARALVQDAEFERMRSLYEDGKLVDVRVEVPLRKVRSRGNPSAGVEYGEYRVVMLKNEDDRPGREVFTRGSVTVYENAARGNYTGLLMANKNDILTKFLGDSEDVSHTRWQLSRVKATELGYVNAFCDTAMGCVKDFFKALGSDIAGLNRPRVIENALSDILYYTKKEDAGQLPPKREKIAVGPDVPPIEPAPKRPYNLRQTEDGFRLYRNPDVDGFQPLRVSLGYCGRNRQPDYDRADFVLGQLPISIRTDGDVSYSLGEEGDNLTISEMSAGSSITVCGFDINRQLVVTTKRVKA